MKLRILTYVLVVFIGIIKGVAQQLCLNIDSVKVYSVPLDLKTTISLDENAIRKIDLNEAKKIVSSDLKKVKSFYDLTILQELASVNFTDTINKSKQKDIDVRILIDIYFAGNYISVGVNNQFCYRYLGKIYFNNKLLDSWLRKYVLN